MKKKMKSFAALFAAVTIMLGAMPGTAMADDNYATATNATTTTQFNSNVSAGGCAIVAKSLVIEKTANIPNVEFEYRITSAEQGSSVSNTGADAAKYVYKASNNDEVSVFRGINASAIVATAYDVDTSANATGDAAGRVSAGTNANATTSANTAADVYDDVKGIKLTYAEQRVSKSGTGDSATISLSTDIDAVTISNAFYSESDKTVTSTDSPYYTANKYFKLDFSACGFTEPGVYRYYIDELHNGATPNITTGTATATTGLDSRTDSVITFDPQLTRTIDVYVQDTDVPNSTGANTLEITGYVMYYGKVTNSSALSNTQNTTTNNTTKKLETTSVTTLNGYEVAGGEKSSGFINEYETVDLTIGKRVDGNQGAKDKYFKYDVVIDGLYEGQMIEISHPGDKSSSSLKVSCADETEANSKPNYATVDSYTNKVISDANSVATYTDAADYSTRSQAWGKTVAANATSVSFEFYLRSGDYVTLTNLPKTATYTISETNEDYTEGRLGDFVSDDSHKGIEDLAKYVSGNATSLSGLDVTANKSLTEETSTPDITSALAVSAVAAENGRMADIEYVFHNVKAGVLPTGIIMSVAPAIAVGLLVLAAIFGLVIGGKRKELEEE